MSFAIDISKFQVKFKRHLAILKQNILINLCMKVIEDTPVLSGQLRSNWNFSVGGPDYSTSPTIYKSTRSVVAMIKRLVTDKDEPYFLANGLPYAYRIEFEGHSSQKAPQGMVRVNMAKLPQIVREETALLRAIS